MRAVEKEITDLIWQHQAIRAHIKLIIGFFDSMTMQSAPVTEQAVQVNDLKRLCLWPLYDFREALQRHISMDDGVLISSMEAIPKVEDLFGEHADIRKQADSAVRQVENAVYGKLDGDELNQCVSGIGEELNGILELIETHTEKEESLLRLVRIFTDT